MKINYKSLVLLLVLVVGMIIMVSAFSNTNANAPTSGEVMEYFENDRVYYFEVDGYSVLKIQYLQYEVDAEGTPIIGSDGNYIFKRNAKGEYDLGYTEYSLVYQFELEKIIEIATSGELKNLSGYNIQPVASAPWYQVYLPWIILGLLLVGLWIFVAKSAGGAGGKMNNFAKSKAKLTGSDIGVKFTDVAGADEEKAELEEVVEFLKDPSKFIKLGARIPRGVLLVGPPGTGKTLLAKAVAGEAGVPFFSISGSDFVEMYVGVGASRVRDLFENARKSNASIIFIDEIDAVGRHRGAGLGGGHDEREQTLNQLLVEMDGFGTNSGVIVMAATNRPDILDPALLRPGRFDRRITVNYPDIKGREEVLKVHCRNKPLEKTVDLHKIAQTTIGFTGAELANLMNESALNAAKKNKQLIGMDDIEESYMKMLLGPQKKHRVRTEKDNKLCAYHEAGHAIASYYCENTDPVKHITIIPAGNAGGLTLSVPTEDKMGMSRNEMLDDIVVDLGGRVAEQIILDDISTGASSDISHATKLANAMVTKYGMSAKLGTVLYGSTHSQDEVFLGRDFSSGKTYSEETAASIDQEIRDIIASCYTRCEEILRTHIDKLHFVAEFLLKNEFMDEDQFAACMKAENPTVEEIELIATTRKKQSEAENTEAQKKATEAKSDLELERERLAREALAESDDNAINSDEVMNELMNMNKAASTEANDGNVEQASDSATTEQSSENNQNTSDNN